MKIDTKLPTSGNPIELKEKGLELQNFMDDVGKYVSAYQVICEQIDSEIDRLKDQSLIDTDNIEEYKKKPLDIKKSYGRTSIKYKIEISPPFEDEFIKKIEGSYTYYDLKTLRSLYGYKLNRIKNKYFEIQNSVDYIKYYPMKHI